MAYEIIKGSEKDFESAPEWARFRTVSYFFEGFSEGLRWGYIPSGCDFVSNHGTWQNAESMFKHHINNIIAERRPITEPVWDGEGLPPVGEKVEYRTRNFPPPFIWTRATIKYASTHTVVLGVDFEKDSDKESVHYPENIIFRPIRSTEDVARDEAVKAMFLKVDPNIAVGIDARQAIYDAIAAGKIPGVKLEAL